VHRALTKSKFLLCNKTQRYLNKEEPLQSLSESLDQNRVRFDELFQKLHSYIHYYINDIFLGKLRIKCSGHRECVLPVDAEAYANVFFFLLRQQIHI
jgi:hypothetical protein